MSDAILTATGPRAMADRDVCIAVGEDLQRHYPGHMWLVGCNHEAGTIAIDLPYQKPLHLQHYGYLLHIERVLGPGGQALVMRAGGELLERFGLRRGAANGDSAPAAAEHGLETGGAVMKSRH